MNPNQSEIPVQSEIHLTPAQFKYAAAILAGKTKKEAIEEAGYAPGTSSSNVEESKNLKKALILAMENNGLTSEALGRKIAEGVNARKIHFHTFKGQVTGKEEIPDNETQHKYVTTALKVRGDLDEKTTEINVNQQLIEIPVMSKSADEWNEKA